MRGLPMTRVTTPDGRWEHTLYDGGGDGEPFIHALDTVESRSVCIDLPQLEGERRITQVGLALAPDGGSLTVTDRGGELLATVDTETFEVSDPPSAAEPSGDEAAEGGLGVVALGVIGGLALIGGAIFLRRRRPPAEPPADPFEPGAPERVAGSAVEHEREKVDA